MSRVRIIGGGLSGVLAAFEAHRLGARDIELHERFEQLGGSALPTERHGVELRERFIPFGPKDDPVRQRLEAHGVAFDEVENRVGSVSPSDAGPPRYTPGFDGPALPCAQIAVDQPQGPSLAGRIIAFPAELREPLARYVRWRLGPGSTEAHANAAASLGVARILPLDADAASFAAARRSNPRIDAFFAMAQNPWAHDDMDAAGEPAGGFGALFRRCHRALRQIGVRIQESSFVAPRQALVEHRPGDVLVWAANPAPLFRMFDRPVPRLLETSHAAYVFAARWTGPRPFRVNNFTADGVCFRVCLYESAGRTLLTAECAKEADPTDLRYEVHRLVSGFEGDLALGELLCSSVKPRWTYQTVEAVAALAQLRGEFGQRFGAGAVSNGWEHGAPTERFRHLAGELGAVLAANVRASAA
ncbi:MAG: NAD(P)-binding protein [Phenylobacterium sp.]|uniref:NAD(P)-binding protein n=1 Tax=Phenylobacterium sp. TaxID=1871053 RepID=UPI0025E49610|nr:NAD(P)-binding protein [Phenylobacterium sp.]MBI1197437.1 NAD(P)-binding protein [Phenylobacterium sp.]